jgi:4-hydroxy-tetrahydrodipicolinate synthase
MTAPSDGKAVVQSDAPATHGSSISPVTGVAPAHLKEWARERFVGLEAIVWPSFTPGTLALDEAGVRWDVRQCLDFGAFCLLPVGGGLAGEEHQRFLEIVCDEARGRALVSVFTGLAPTVEANVAALKHAEAVGASHALMGWPTSFLPNSSKDALYRWVREICDQTSLAVVLYASERWDFVRFHQSAIPFDLFDRLADIPNAVAMKVGFFEPGLSFELFERFGRKLLVNVGCPQMLGELPLLRKLYGVQWAGVGTLQVWQSVDRPYLTDFFSLTLQGKYEQAMQAYWQMYPLQRYAMANVAHGYGSRYQTDQAWAQLVTWSVGGNGGPLRGGYHVYQSQIDERKAVLKAAGIEPREPIEEFFAGRVNYAKGT